MLEPIVTFFDKLIENFSWRRLMFVLTVLFLAGVLVWVYEGYTSTFRLAKIEKQAALIEQLASLSVDVASRPALKQATLNLENQLLSTTQIDTGNYELLPWGKKVLATFVAWLIFWLFILLSPSARKSSVGNSFLGMVVVAAPFVALAAAIPTFEALWVNYFAYPIGTILLVAVLILGWQRRLRRKSTQQPIAPISA